MGYFSNLTRKKRIIIIVAICISVVVVAKALIIADKNLSPLQMFALVAGLVVIASIVEIIGVAYEEKHRAKNPQNGTTDLIGKKGIVIEDCSPEGRVKIGSEIWSAIIKNGTTLKKDKEIIVQERQGLKLIVKPYSESV